MSTSAGGWPPSPEPQRYRYSVGNLRFDEAKWVVTVDGEPVPLDPMPMRLLACLLRHRNDVVTKDDLLGEVWHGNTEIQDGAIFQMVSRLRRQLGEQAGKYIETVTGQGYRINAPLERTAVGAVPHISLSFEPGQDVPGRADFQLTEILSNTRHRSVWRARSKIDGTNRVFKFAATAEELAKLKREATIYIAIGASALPGNEFVRMFPPNFAHVPFFLECEYGGQDMNAWAQTSDELQQWSLEQRLALFLQIASRVVTLHRLPAVHGDLKPANVVLRTEDGRLFARIIDFGSGIPLDKERLRQLGVSQLGLTVADGASAPNAAGTWMYLAPELLDGRPPSTASDVFSLGVILYQLIVADLRRPLATGWERDIHDALLVQDIADATQREAARRIGSVSELIARVDSLVQRRARADALAEEDRRSRDLAAKLHRQELRRPWIISAIVVLGIGFAVSTWFYWESRVALARAQEAASRARAISAFLAIDILQAADVTGAGPRKAILISHILERASASASERFANHPETEGEVRMQLADFFYRLSAFKSAEKDYRSAARLIRYQPELAVRAQYQLALSLCAQSRLPEADEAIRTGDAAAAQRNVAQHPVVRLAAAQAKSLYASFSQRYEDALIHARNAVVLNDEVHPTNFGLRFSARRALAEVLHRMGKIDEMQIAVTEMTSAPFSQEAIGEVLFARGQLTVARLKHAQKRPAEALAPLRAARDALSRRLGPNESTVGGITEELARTHLELGEFAEARAGFTEAHRILLLSYGPEHQQTRSSSLNIALVGLGDGNSKSALARLESDRPWFVANMNGERSPVVQLIDFFRARAMLDLGMATDAVTLLNTLDLKVLNQASPDPLWEPYLKAEHGRHLLLTGRTSKGREALASAIRALKEGGAQPWEIARLERALPPL